MVIACVSLIRSASDQERTMRSTAVTWWLAAVIEMFLWVGFLDPRQYIASIHGIEPSRPGLARQLLLAAISARAR